MVQRAQRNEISFHLIFTSLQPSNLIFYLLNLIHLSSLFSLIVEKLVFLSPSLSHIVLLLCLHVVCSILKSSSWFLSRSLYLVISSREISHLLFFFRIFSTLDISFYKPHSLYSSNYVSKPLIDSNFSVQVDWPMFQHLLKALSHLSPFAQTSSNLKIRDFLCFCSFKGTSKWIRIAAWSEPNLGRWVSWTGENLALKPPLPQTQSSLH